MQIVSLARHAVIGEMRFFTVGRGGGHAGGVGLNAMVEWPSSECRIGPPRIVGRSDDRRRR